MNNRYNLNLIEPPISEPITLSEIKLWLKIEDSETADDNVLQSLMKWARQYVEAYTKRALYTQTWELVSNYAFSPVNFPLGMLQSVSSVKIIKDNESETIEDANKYTVTLGDSGKLFLKNGNTWASGGRGSDSFKIKFVCGWSNIVDIPEMFKIVIKQLVAYKYENREYNDKDVIMLLQQSGIGKLY
jgi:uncharacterized phiE125 gp8 family phage protein